MRNYCLLFLFALLFLSASSTLHAKKKFNKQLFLNSKYVYQATVKFRKEYEAAFSTFKKGLERNRESASRTGDISEVKRIEKAISGDIGDGFENSANKALLKTYSYKLTQACRRYITDLKKAKKAELSAGNTDKAEEIEFAISKLEPLLSTGRPFTKTVRIEADKDWQNTGIEVTKGAEVELSCSGKWGPGRRERTGHHRWKTITGDADTYNLQVRVDTAVPEKGGKKWDFTARRSGELSMRMAQYVAKARKGDAKGTLSVKVTVSPADPASDIQGMVSYLLKPLGASANKKSKRDNGEKEISKTGMPKEPDAFKDSSSTTFTVKADESWQETSIFVPNGAKITILADGKWTNGRKNKLGKLIWGGPNRFKIQLRIGKKNAGKCGAQKTFTASSEGILSLRMAGRDYFKEKGFSPSGEMTVEISVSE